MNKRVVVSNDRKVGAFEVASPFFFLSMNYGEKLLFARGVICFRWREFSALISNGSTLLRQNCTKAVDRGVTGDLEWFKKIREYQHRCVGESMLKVLERSLALGCPFVGPVLFG